MMGIVDQEFPETRCRKLLELRDPSHPRYAEHLEQLAKRYYGPVHSYAQARAGPTPTTSPAVLRDAALAARTWRSVALEAAAASAASSKPPCGTHPERGPGRRPARRRPAADEATSLPEQAFDANGPAGSRRGVASAEGVGAVPSRSSASIASRRAGRPMRTSPAAHGVSETTCANRLREARQRPARYPRGPAAGLPGSRTGHRREVRFILSK